MLDSRRVRPPRGMDCGATSDRQGLRSKPGKSPFKSAHKAGERLFGSAEGNPERGQIKVGVFHGRLLPFARRARPRLVAPNRRGDRLIAGFSRSFLFLPASGGSGAVSSHGADSTAFGGRAVRRLRLLDPTHDGP